jgi:hypothetical protein
MELKDKGEIYRFLRSQRGVIFVIDQLNALEEKKSDSETKAKEKARLHQWLYKLIAFQKAVLGSSANNYTMLDEQLHQGNTITMHARGGLSKVSLKSNNSFVKSDASNHDLDGNGTLVEAE